MPTSFFNSWALWEKMTFALALAILTVFGIGYGKLLLMNRLVKKQEGKDEEQRIAAEQSQRSGPIMESHKSPEIPFGVRAIQSGIRVEGIWISKDTTPTPSSLKIGHLRKNSSDLTGSRSPSPRDSLDISQTAIQAASGRGRAIRADSEMGTLATDQHSTSAETQDARGYRPSYQPRRSSHLRYDNHEETIDQLGGRVAAGLEMNREKAVGTQDMDNDALSVEAADDQRASDFENYLASSSSTQARTDQRQSLPQFTGGRALLESATFASSRPPRASLPLQISRADYCPVRPDSSEHERTGLLRSPRPSSPETSPPFMPPYARTTRELAANGEKQVPPLSYPHQPPFISGELHMNKAVRKVNSGFEVLPAGTFGVPVELNGEAADHEGRCNQDDEDDEKRHSNKLQKKPRTSVS